MPQLLTKRTIHSALFVFTLALITSCSGQNSSAAAGKPALPAPGDTVKALANNIMLVYQDKKNNYWFGSWEEGLYSYNGKIIIRYTTEHGLPDNRIDEIKEDQAGNIYINTPKGISKFDGQMFSTLPVAQPGDDWKLEPNDLWFKQGWTTGAVYRYDGKWLHSLTFPNTKVGDEYFSLRPSFPGSPYCVYSIYQDTRGNIWFGTAVLGVCRFDGKTIDWISEPDVTEMHDGPANGVRSVIEDKDGYFWFNSEYRYNIYGNKADQQQFYSREKSVGSLDGKANGNLTEYLSIAKDNNNELWIATYRNGVWRVNGQSITHYPVKQGGKDITVFSIYKDNDGNLWLGTHESGVYKLNGEAFERFKP